MGIGHVLFPVSACIQKAQVKMHLLSLMQFYKLIIIPDQANKDMLKIKHFNKYVSVNKYYMQLNI